MHDEVGKLPVVGEEEQSLAVPVQAAHGVDPGFQLLHQLGDAPAAQLVAGGGDVSPGLIEHDIEVFLFLFQPHPLAVNGDDVGGQGGMARLRRTAVDGEPSGADVFLRFAAGEDAAVAKELLDSDGLWHIFVLSDCESLCRTAAFP